MIDLSIIIPAYNEAARITPTITSFHEFLAARAISFELIVVDDGSTDHTVSLVNALCAALPHLSVIPLPANKGKGYAVRTGMLAARGNIRLFSDADGSTPVTEIDKLLAALKNGTTNIAIGSRYLAASEVMKAQPKARVIWSRLVNRIMQRVLLPGIVDPHCGFKAFTAAAAQRIFQQCTINGWSFDLEALAIAQKLQLRVQEVPVKWANDERSKGRLSHLPKEFYNVCQIRKRLQQPVSHTLH